MNTKLQESYVSDENYLATLDQVMPLLREENFGIPGGIRAWYRDIKGSGGAFDAWIGGVRQDATLQGGKGDEQFTYSKWFDESLQDLSATDMLMNTIAYMKAKSLDSGGRVSDKDVENQKRALGFERDCRTSTIFVRVLSRITPRSKSAGIGMPLDSRTQCSRFS